MKKAFLFFIFLVFCSTKVYSYNIVKIKKDICSPDQVQLFYEELSKYYVDDFSEVKDILYLDVVFCRNLSLNTFKDKEFNADNIFVNLKLNGMDETYNFRLSNFYVGGWNQTLPDPRCSGIGDNGGIQVKGFFLNLYGQIYRQGEHVINLYGIRPENLIK